MGFFPAGSASLAFLITVAWYVYQQSVGQAVLNALLLLSPVFASVWLGGFVINFTSYKNDILVAPLFAFTCVYPMLYYLAYQDAFGDTVSSVMILIAEFFKWCAFVFAVPYMLYETVVGVLWRNIYYYFFILERKKRN